MTIKVRETIKSTRTDDAPVEMKLYTGDDYALAIAAAAAAIAKSRQDLGWTKTLAVTITLDDD